MQLHIIPYIFIIILNIFTYNIDEVVSEQKKTTFIITEYDDPNNEKWLWETILKYSEDEKIAAGIMGYFWRESFFKSNATAHWATVSPYLGRDIPVEFTAEVDIGLKDGSTRDYFIESIRERIGGYGLGQWYSYHYLEDLYDYAQEWGSSISDAEMQCAFVVESMKAEDELWDYLLEAKDAYWAGLIIAYRYDGLTGEYAEGLAQFSKEFYEEYSTKGQ